jgi:hypothetical protein
MTATLVGSLNPGLLNPISLSCLGAAGAQLSAQLTGALNLQAQVAVTPPTLALQLEALLSAVAQLQAGIALGLPAVSFSVTQAAALVASIEAQIGLLGVLTALLGGPAMYVYEYSGGTVSTLGTDIAAGLSGSPPPGLVPSSSVAGLLIGAGVTDWVTLSPYFGGLGV